MYALLICDIKVSFEFISLFFSPPQSPRFYSPQTVNSVRNHKKDYKQAEHTLNGSNTTAKIWSKSNSDGKHPQYKILERANKAFTRNYDQ